MTEPIEPNGAECFDCGAVIEDADPTADCEVCAGDNVGAVLITPCTAGAECRDESHHFGIHMHVESVDE